LGKTVSVSFEGSSVKIVHASFKGKRLTVENTQILPENEFDSCLRREKASEFIVTAEFRESYHDIIKTPVVKEEFLKKIIESEIRKVIVQKDFSFVYSTVGEKIVDNRKILEVFYYAVPKDSIRNTVERFYDSGKVVRALYPSVFSAASLIDQQVSGEAHMGILSSGKSRLVFFVRKGSIYFLRNYESYETGLSDFDIQNINMTVSYCFQNLRMNPTSVFLIGDLSESSGTIQAMSTAPLASLSKAEYIHCARDLFNEFTLPIASFFTPRTSNILSDEFKKIYRLRNYMAYASRVFVLLAFLCSGAVLFEWNSAQEKKELIQNMKKGGVDVERVLADYGTREVKRDLYMPLVGFLNRPVHDMQGVLVSLGRTDFRKLTLNEITASHKDDANFTVLLEGIASADSYAAMQDSLDTVMKELTKTGKPEITNRSVELRDKTFSVELSYRTGE